MISVISIAEQKAFAELETCDMNRNNGSFNDTLGTALRKLLFLSPNVSSAIVNDFKDAIIQVAMAPTFKKQ